MTGQLWEDLQMKIDLLTTELRTGGAERCLTELALGLDAAGQRVRVMSLAPLPLPPRNGLVDRLLARGIDVQSCDVRRAREFVPALRKVRHWLAEGLPDVLQTFLYHANVTGAVAARRFPHLRVVAGVRVAQPHFGRTLLESRLSRRFAGIVSVSHSVEAFVRRRWRPASKTRLITIPNGISEATFEPCEPINWSEWGLADSGPLVLFLGRLHRQKGLDLLLDVAPTLWQLYPELRLAIVGEGPLEKQVQRTIARLPSGRAARLPWQADVAPLYAGADVVILPSRYEGMPNVVLEAMAAERCVVAADVEGVAELLGPNAGPQSFPPGDRGSMVQRLDGLLRGGQMTELAKSNRERALGSFSVAAMVDRYGQFYCDLLGRDS